MRSDGFDRMDISTSITDDPKFRRLARRHPELLATALAAYLGLLATCWREGERLVLEEGWPPLLPFDQATADSMQEAELVDSETRVPERVWTAWYGAAAERRRIGRDRQRRADVKRGRARPIDVSQAEQTDSQAVSQAGPTPDHHGSNAGPTNLHTPLPKRTNGRAPVPIAGACRTCGGDVTDKEPCKVGPGWIEHAEHPAEWQTAGSSGVPT